MLFESGLYLLGTENCRLMGRFDMKRDQLLYACLHLSGFWIVVLFDIRHFIESFQIYNGIISKIRLI